MEIEHYLSNEQASISLGKRLASLCKNPAILTFSGAIGAGKTTLIRAFIKESGISGAIKSPTFSLVESYFLATHTIHHFDLYRINDIEELDYIGYRDYFTENSICIIEWPERAVDYLPQIDIHFTLYGNDCSRKLKIVANTNKGSQILTALLRE
jgi:tRNA threonylcarbamoyladenosine biosynthesis protein TsaE